MQKKPLTLNQVKFNQVKSDLKFWSPVERNGWYIKFSISKDESVLLIFISAYTCQTIIRYFENENDAVKYINFLCEKDPSILLQGNENPA
jgi:hypothetical protein